MERVAQVAYVLSNLSSESDAIQGHCLRRKFVLDSMPVTTVESLGMNDDFANPSSGPHTSSSEFPPSRSPDSKYDWLAAVLQRLSWTFIGEAMLVIRQRSCVVRWLEVSLQLRLDGRTSRILCCLKNMCVIPDATRPDLHDLTFSSIPTESSSLHLASRRRRSE